MPDIERLRRAFGEWEYYKERPQDVGQEVDAWIEAIVEGWKRGYEIAVVNDTEAELFEAGQAVDITSYSAEDISPEGGPSVIQESDWREAALHFLEGEVEKIVTEGDLIWIESDTLSGTNNAMNAFDELDA